MKALSDGAIDKLRAACAAQPGRARPRIDLARALLDALTGRRGGGSG